VGRHVNERMAELDIDARIDHRSWKAQGSSWSRSTRSGRREAARAGGSRAGRGSCRIARENGEKIIADPRIALDGITRQQATFTTRDLACSRSAIRRQGAVRPGDGGGARRPSWWRWGRTGATRSGSRRAT
jgi:hypothetical protein